MGLTAEAEETVKVSMHGVRQFGVVALYHTMLLFYILSLSYIKLYLLLYCCADSIVMLIISIILIFTIIAIIGIID